MRFLHFVDAGQGWLAPVWGVRLATPRRPPELVLSATRTPSKSRAWAKPAPRPESLERIDCFSHARRIYGVAIDADDAVVVDTTGKAKLLQSSPHPGAAYFLIGGPATQVKAGKPLIYRNIEVMRLDAPGQYYDLRKHCGTGRRYIISVDARRAKPFGRMHPYSFRGVVGTYKRQMFTSHERGRPCKAAPSSLVAGSRSAG